MREVSPVPRSKNPKFYRSWTKPGKEPDFEAVCTKWEGEQITRAMTSSFENPEED
jgi:hypothetical protein